MFIGISEYKISIFFRKVFVDNIEIIIHYKVIFTMMMCHESGAEFLSTLTDFVNLVIDGRCPADVAPVFFGG